MERLEKIKIAVLYPVMALKFLRRRSRPRLTRFSCMREEWGVNITDGLSDLYNRNPTLHLAVCKVGLRLHFISNKTPLLSEKKRMVGQLPHREKAGGAASWEDGWNGGYGQQAAFPKLARE